MKMMTQMVEAQPGTGNSDKPPDKGVLFCVLQIYLT